MKSVIIIHDSYSSNSEPWIVAVTDELKVRGFAAYAPKFPTPIGQDYISWKALFSSYTQYITPESVLVGIGVGCAFLMRFLSEQPSIKVAKTVLVAPFATPLANPSEQLLATSFLLPAFDATLLRQQMGIIDVVVSDNDLIVDFASSKQVADMFGAHITRMEGKGHFRAINGVRLLPELVEVVVALDAVPVAAPAPTMLNSMPSAAMPIQPVAPQPAVAAPAMTIPVQPAPVVVPAAPVTPVAVPTVEPVVTAAPVAQPTPAITIPNFSGMSSAPVPPQPVVSPIPSNLQAVASQVGSSVAATDVAALQRLLVELQSKGVNVQTSAPVFNQPVAPAPVATPSVTMPAPAVAPVMAQTMVPPATTAPVAAPASSVAPATSASPVAPADPVARVQPEGAVSHSLVSDFSTSLINADAKELSTTLIDYRKGKEYGIQEKAMKTLRVIAMIVGVVLLLGAGYFAYRVYFFNETLPSIRELDIPPLNAVDTQAVTLDRSSTPKQAIESITDGNTELDLTDVGSIGVLKITDQDDQTVTSDLAMRLIGGAAPSSIYSKLDSFYAIGTIKSPETPSVYAMFALAKPEPEVRAELVTWETWMVNDLVQMFAPGTLMSPETHTFTFEDRVIGNRNTRVLVATKKTAPPAPNTDAETTPEEAPAEVSLPEQVPITGAEDIVQTLINSTGIPDVSNPVLPLETTVQNELGGSDVTTNATNIASAAESTLPVDPKPDKQVIQKTEKNIIQIFKISPTEQTAIKRTRKSLIISANSPLFEKGILPGDMFALESFDKEDDIDLETDAALLDPNSRQVPILGGTPTIVQITDILQRGSKTELGIKILPLQEAIALVGQEVYSNVLPSGASILAPEGQVIDEGPKDIFGYSIVNGKVLIFSADPNQIPTLAKAYFDQKKSIMDMFN